MIGGGKEPSPRAGDNAFNLAGDGDAALGPRAGPTEICRQAPMRSMSSRSLEMADTTDPGALRVDREVVNPGAPFERPN